MIRRIARLFWSAVAFAVVGCGDDATSPSSDASVMTDAAPADAGVVDAANGDASTADAGGDWAFCPPASSFVGDNAWTATLTVTDEAIYCATFQEGRSLAEDLAQKALLRLVPGTYRLPARADEPGLAFSLPLCMRTNDAELDRSSGTAGRVRRFGGVFDGSETFRWFADFPGVEGGFELVLAKQAPVGTVPSVVVDGSPGDPLAVDEGVHARACPEPCPSEPSRAFDACAYPGPPSYVDHATFTSDGEASFELHLGSSLASTEPGAFMRAHGTFRGVAFDQRSYWKLAYSPGHHHFTRAYGVLFDAPIDGVCGLEVFGIGLGSEGGPTAHTVDCAMARTGTIALDGVTTSRGGS